MSRSTSASKHPALHHLIQTVQVMVVVLGLVALGAVTVRVLGG